ncbi:MULTISPECIES: hypothetical protein [unclassified Lentimonas]|uniref:hypothetical protein n=1 Tax=unclassified Lentimonas TaxID=2630993 RepID=UPI00132639FE|nr:MULTISPECIES: hypothetical protein [unclassified Lentimonas]CAA6693015.1 Unannotated [Lentimonas sp. CC10]CAA6695714.1 Unannotated [Lentimonas sp. CC19]CAA7070005.1 Unannotated [Lentimonas sp. CC11]
MNAEHQTTPLLLGITGIHAEELAVELGIRDKLIESLQQSDKPDLASILYRPLGRAVVFQLTTTGDRVEWSHFEGDAKQVHELFQELTAQ